MKLTEPLLHFHVSGFAQRKFVLCKHYKGVCGSRGVDSLILNLAYFRPSGVVICQLHDLADLPLEEYPPTPILYEVGCDV